MSAAAELLGLIIANTSDLPASNNRTAQSGLAGNKADKSSLSCASTRTSSPGSCSCESNAFVTAAQGYHTLSDGETLAHRRRVRELELNDLGIDLPEATDSPTKKHVVMTPSCRVVSVATPACDVISTSPACANVTGWSGGDASQRTIPNQLRRMPPAQLRSDAGLRTPANATSTPLSIASTTPAAMMPRTDGNDASARTPSVSLDVNLPNDMTTPPCIVSTKPTTLHISSRAGCDASMRTPVTCLDMNHSVEAEPPTPTSNTPSQDASTRTPLVCQGSMHHELSWLLVGARLSSEQMVEKLRDAAPEMYED